MGEAKKRREQEAREATPPRVCACACGCDFLLSEGEKTRGGQCGLCWWSNVHREPGEPARPGWTVVT